MPFASRHILSISQSNPKFQQPLPKVQSGYRPTISNPTGDGYTDKPSRVSYFYYGSELQETSSQDGTGTSFGNTKNDQSAPLAKLQLEKITVDTSVQNLEAKIGMLSRSKANGNTIDMLVALRETLQEDVAMLRRHAEAYKDVDPQCLTMTAEEVERLRREAERWTNNIDILETWLCKTHGFHAEQLDRLRREFYGSEYREGVGLKEL
ncbi:MAG: hypothetical protein LQ346_001197 [Caloplaca aetnensis]|nr:MAG: hypothetical protein LQ346_001197 [Caloplaca aetnensis]